MYVRNCTGTVRIHLQYLDMCTYVRTYVRSYAIPVIVIYANYLRTYDLVKFIRIMKDVNTQEQDRDLQHEID